MDQENNKFHALQLFTDTFSAETVHLTNEAVGIYIRLLCFCWTKNAKPFTTSSAYRICGCKSKECERIVNLVLKEFFKPNTIVHNPNLDSWSHKRLTAEHEYLTDKYKKRSEAGRKGGLATQNQAKADFALSKIKAPIPIPSPIPNKNIRDNFEQFWSLLSNKKGSKFLAGKKYALQCADMIPEEVATTFNRYASTVKDKEFLAHVSTWINQRRFEDDENNKTDIKSIIERLVALGYEHTGRVHNYEKFIKDGKKYKINRLDENNMIVPD